MLLKHCYVIILCLCFFQNTIAQSNTDGRRSLLNKIEIFAGTKIRVTPIYLGRLRSETFYFEITPLEEPDSYLSGFGSFFLDEKFSIGKSLSLVFHQSVRKDYLVDHVRLGPTYPYLSDGVEKRFIYDLYAHLLLDLRKNRVGKLFLTTGIGFSGLNTGHIVTVRTYTNSIDFTDTVFKRNYIYPTASIGVRWDRKKIGAALIIGYPIKNPDFLYYRPKFLLPEINFHYKLFSKKEE